MNDVTQLIALYDSCVLYPAPLRDLLMHLSLADLFRAKWTETIHDEWTRNILANRPDLTKEQLQRTRDLMNAHVRDCLVTGYESLIPALSLPDSNDRHVLAAAIRASASIIVTYNLKDFPSEWIDRYDAAFNRSQADIISHCTDKENIVVLLEECVVSSEQCRKLLSSEFVVYLKVSIPTQLDRMKGGRVPSLPVNDMKDFLEKQHREDAFYEEVATLIVESGGVSDQDEEINETVDRDVNKVIKALEE